jgi:hypothetical protein
MHKSWIVGNNFHKKAGQVEVVLAVSARKLIADRREALRYCLPCSVHHRRIATLPSALFVERLLRCQLVSSIQLSGCCHLGIELHSFCFQRSAFFAEAAVTRTRRSAMNQI